ncbi:iron ABC transporter substrate-binding protein [Adhaeribacter arboris]|uniref:Iron ABC transporter substrate-binding protein n=1 Tax=Adhaeribacter arboris TaxID=2072846 RepID=A0A2T2YDP7_9BACT|nr:helical backbone metal receptor [Adhaeribacter arboris]PSR53639.1 iron ABC transporter substrate-binding protein [Adhaeribacter arboris]
MPRKQFRVKILSIGLRHSLWFLLYAGFGCQSGNENVKKHLPVKEYITVTDDLGRKLKIPHYPKRIMALAPSATEMLYAVCDENQIIARTQNCDYPAKVKNKPVVNNYPMDYETLIKVKPDLIFTVHGITPPEVAARIQELGIPVYFQTFEKLNDVFDRLVDIGKIMHRDAYAMYYADSLRRELKNIAARNAKISFKPKVLAITWNDPIYVYGRNTIFTDKLRLLGAENAVTEVMSQPYPALTREYILKINPDVIIGGTFGKMDSTFFQQYPELKQINAYQNRRIFAATDDLMSRPSPRVVESVHELQSLLKL